MDARSTAVIWLDEIQAMVILISSEQMERHWIDKGGEKDTFLMFAKIGSFLMKCRSVLILGPGLAKHRLELHLVSTLPHLSKGILGCESLAQPSDPLMVGILEKVTQMGKSSFHF